MKSSSGKRWRNSLLKIVLLAAGVGLAAGIWGLSPPEEMSPPQTPPLIEKEAVERVNLNAATLFELMSLPGIGEKTAQRIVEYRIEHGNYSSIESVMEVQGIGPEKFKKMTPYITVK